MTAGPSLPEFIGTRYDVREVLGEGGMGRVYRARQRSSDHDVALKVLALSGEDDRLRFLREVRSMAALRHPGIIRVHDFGTEGSTGYIAMDLIEGRTLRQFLDAGPCEPGRAVAIVARIASVLEHAHRGGIVHRDIKPANAFLLDDDTVMVGDFGLARTIAGGETITRGGIIMGTPAYLAPESLTETAGPAGDQYALATMAFEMLTGQLPFEGATPLELILGRTRRAPRRPRDLVPSLPLPVEICLLRALDRNPAARHATVGAFGEDLARAWRGPRAAGAVGRRSPENRGPATPDPGSATRPLVRPASGIQDPATGPVRGPGHDVMKRTTTLCLVAILGVAGLTAVRGFPSMGRPESGPDRTDAVASPMPAVRSRSGPIPSEIAVGRALGSTAVFRIPFDEAYQGAEDQVRTRRMLGTPLREEARRLLRSLCEDLGSYPAGLDGSVHVMIYQAIVRESLDRVDLPFKDIWTVEVMPLWTPGLLDAYRREIVPHREDLQALARAVRAAFIAGPYGTAAREALIAATTRSLDWLDLVSELPPGPAIPDGRALLFQGFFNRVRDRLERIERRHRDQMRRVLGRVLEVDPGDPDLEVLAGPIRDLIGIMIDRERADPRGAPIRVQNRRLLADIGERFSRGDWRVAPGDRARLCWEGAYGVASLLAGEDPAIDRDRAALAEVLESLLLRFPPGMRLDPHADQESRLAGLVAVKPPAGPDGRPIPGWDEFMQRIRKELLRIRKELRGP